MTSFKIYWNELELPPINLWNVPMLTTSKFTIRVVDGNICVVYREGDFEYIKLVFDKQELEEINKQKEKYGH